MDVVSKAERVTQQPCPTELAKLGREGSLPTGSLGCAVPPRTIERKNTQ